MTGLHVVVVNDAGHVNGGSAQVAIGSAKALAREGVQVHYFCATPPVDESLQQSGVQVICTQQQDLLGHTSRLAAAVQGFWNGQAARALHELLRSLPASRTVVHVHGWTKALTASIFLPARKMGMAQVLTLHDYFTACPNGGFFDYQRREICHRRPVGLDCITTHCDARAYSHKLWRVGRHLVNRYGANVPAGLTDVIVLSRNSKRVLAPSYPTHVRWHAVRNPIEITRQDRVLAGQNRDFLFVGRLAAEKGADLLAEAAQAVGAPVRFIGDGGEKQAMLKRWPNLKISGWLPPAGVQAALQTGRALVLPSRWYEGQPLVVQEALAMGVPVIVADQTGSCDLVVDGVNGLLFRQGDYRALQASLHRLMTDDALVDAMSGAAYDGYWQDPPVPAHHVRDLLPVYELALSALAPV